MPILATSSWTDAAALAERVLVVPVGATEQHGPHLPLTTDTDIAVTLAGRLLAVLPEAVAVAPPVSFGASGEHQAFTGTLSIGSEALEVCLVELGRSASCTWRRQLLLSTHGGNATAVRGAARRLRREGRDARAWMPSWGGDAHAGRTETSLMLAIAPDRVDLAAARPGATAPLAELMPRLIAHGVAGVSGNGVLGDPTGASAAEGERLLELAVASLCATITWWPVEPVGDERAA
jgi:mycofactocin precursor peptide peptidase